MFLVNVAHVHLKVVVLLHETDVAFKSVEHDNLLLLLCLHVLLKHRQKFDANFLGLALWSMLGMPVLFNSRLESFKLCFEFDFVDLALSVHITVVGVDNGYFRLG